MIDFIIEQLNDLTGDNDILKNKKELLAQKIHDKLCYEMFVEFCTDGTYMTASKHIIQIIQIFGEQSVNKAMNEFNNII